MSKPKTAAKINGEPHALVLLQVTARDERGRISQANILHDDAVVDLSDESQSREFVTAFVRSDMLEGMTVN